MYEVFDMLLSLGHFLPYVNLSDHTGNNIYETSE